MKIAILCLLEMPRPLPTVSLLADESQTLRAGWGRKTAAVRNRWKWRWFRHGKRCWLLLMRWRSGLKVRERNGQRWGGRIGGRS